jgi:hypothetical protein
MPNCESTLGQNPNQFIGYWAYTPATGQLQLLNPKAQAPISVEHPGYNVDFVLPEGAEAFSETRSTTSSEAEGAE